MANHPSEAIEGDHNPEKRRLIRPRNLVIGAVVIAAGLYGLEKWNVMSRIDARVRYAFPRVQSGEYAQVSYEHTFSSYSLSADAIHSKGASPAESEDHVWISPPGAWASTPEEAVQLLRENL